MSPKSKATVFSATLLCPGDPWPLPHRSFAVPMKCWAWRCNLGEEWLSLPMGIPERNKYWHKAMTVTAFQEACLYQSRDLLDTQGFLLAWQPVGRPWAPFHESTLQAKVSLQESAHHRPSPGTRENRSPPQPRTQGERKVEAITQYFFWDSSPT